MIFVTINVERQDLINLGLLTQGEDVECAVNPNTITLFYPSYDDGNGKMGTKIHFSSGENLWCYEEFHDILSRIKNYEKLR